MISTGAKQEFRMTKISDNDPDRAKGATEEEHHHDGNAGLADQLGHRDQNPILKDADSEHSTGRPQTTKKKRKPSVA
jgi:hypothetical protein